MGDQRVDVALAGVGPSRPQLRPEVGARAEVHEAQRSLIVACDQQSPRIEGELIDDAPREVVLSNGDVPRTAGEDRVPQTREAWQVISPELAQSSHGRLPIASGKI